MDPSRLTPPIPEVINQNENAGRKDQGAVDNLNNCIESQISVTGARNSLEVCAAIQNLSNAAVLGIDTTWLELEYSLFYPHAADVLDRIMSSLLLP